MVLFIKKLKIFFILPLLMVLFLVHCGGGGDDSIDDAAIDPIVAPSTEDDLASQAVNTFPDDTITVDPIYIDFGTTDQYEELTETFTVVNSTSDDVTLTLNFYGTSGGFRIVENDGTYSAYKSDFVLAAGESNEFTLQYDARLMGTRSGYVEISAMELTGYIHFPFQGKVTGPADFNVISSSYLCENEEAPLLTDMDFMRVSSGRTETRSFKICNTGGEKIRINSIKFEEDSSDTVSASVNTDPFDGHNFDVTEELLYDFFSEDCSDEYCNPSESEAFEAPVSVSYTSYTGASPDETAAFSVTENSTGGSPDGIAVQEGSYARIDVEFSPTLDADAGDGAIYDPPFPYAAKMIIDTSLGEVEVNLAGSSGGDEPVLKATYAVDENDACLQDECSPCANELDLESENAAIHFGTVGIFEDWVTENSNDIYVRFENAGSDTLNVWFGVDTDNNPIEAGYFLFGEDTQSLPLELGTSRCETVKLKYYPTPENGEAGDTYDFGQLVINHTGGNGPSNGVILIGEEDSSDAVEVLDGSFKLKDTYTDGKTKRFCIGQNDDGTWDDITLTVRNNSVLTDPESNILTSNWTITSLDGGTAADYSDTVEPGPGEESTFTISLTPDTDGDGNYVTEITGHLDIENSYALDGYFDGKDLEHDYDIDFKVTVSETGDCSGGNGNSLDGSATLVVDRITMILSDLETARNPPSFKLHIPVELDKENRSIKIGAVPFDPINTDPNSIKVFKPYNHQMANVTGGCFPLPTNPYKQEREAGSWGDTDTQCEYRENGFDIEGSEACIAPNKPESFVDGDDTYYVFYHEFVKFEPGSCSPEIEGKIATFHMKEGQTIGGIFQEMEDEVGIEPSPGEYREKYEAFLRTYQFDSFIKFNVDYDKVADDGVTTCSHQAGETLHGTTDPEEIRDCWIVFAGDDDMRRVGGMIEECTYFFFDVDEGCVPGEDGCSSDPNDPDTWIGYGEYEPYVDPNTGEEEETKWDFTIRNVHLQGYFIVNSLGSFFENGAKLLYADLYATITTKAIGVDSNNWNDLIAVQNRDDFDEDDIYISFDDAELNWMGDSSVNASFTGGGDDDIDCFDENGSPRTLTSCRGNFLITSDGTKIMPAGEPTDFDKDRNRFLSVGLGSFHGKAGLTPSFAQERSDGTGKPLVFTLHGCMYEGHDVSEDSGCYEEHIDDVDQDGNVISNLLQDYLNHGHITQDDYDAAQSGDPEVQKTSKAWINYKIFNVDRNRFSDYYDVPNEFKFDEDFYKNTPCGAGM